MKKVCIIGHFGFGENLLNGQTIKTKIVTMELEKQLGNFQVIKIDTHGGIKMLPLIIINVIKAFKISENIIILPAHNGIKIFVPLCNFMNIFYKRKLHYVVIGGWLNKFLNTHKYLEKKLKRFNGIYVETNGMKKNLIDKGFVNIYVMPNFKNIKILNINELFYNNEEPFHLCTFSRVMKEKGIEELFYAVRRLKEENEDFVLDLAGFFEDIYKKQVEELEQLGIAHFYGFQSDPRPFYTEADCVVLPSYHEGMSNVLLEAAATGRPVITSNIPGCRESVENGKSGLLVEAKNKEMLYQAMKKMLHCSREEREKMGKAGREKMKREFRKEAVVDRTVRSLE